MAVSRLGMRVLLVLGVSALLVAALPGAAGGGVILRVGIAPVPGTGGTCGAVDARCYCPAGNPSDFCSDGAFCLVYAGVCATGLP